MAEQNSVHHIVDATAVPYERRMAEQNSVHHIVDATAVPYPVGFLASQSISINGDAIAAAGWAGRAIHY